MNFIFTILALFFCFNISAQSIQSEEEQPKDNTEEQAKRDSIRKVRKPKFQGFPVAFYSPETRFAVGAVGFFSFRWKSDSINSRASSVTLGSAYTQNKQVLLYLPYNLYLKNDNYRLNGELGYFKYNFFFFGIGNENSLAQKESYEVTFPRIRLNAFKKIANGTFIGLRYGHDHFQDLKFQEGGVLEKMNIPGTKGGITSSIGFGLISDRRDHQFYPRGGSITEIDVDVDDRWTGSDYKCVKLNFNYTMYRSVGRRSVFAANLNARTAQGDIPFYMLSLLGGGKRLRGQFEGQHRDVHSLQTQIEFRQEFLKNWGFTLFAGTGMVFNTYSDVGMNRLNPGYGGGLRYKLDKKEHVNIRLDVGFGSGQVLPYFTISEAF